MTDEQAKLLGRPIAAGCVCKCDELPRRAHRVCPRHGQVDLYAREKTILALHEPRETNDDASTTGDQPSQGPA